MQHAWDIRVLLGRWRPHNPSSVVGEELDDIGSGCDSAANCLSALLDAIDGVCARWEAVATRTVLCAWFEGSGACEDFGCDE
jgi:hypothetical protein